MSAALKSYLPRPMPTQSAAISQPHGVGTQRRSVQSRPAPVQSLPVATEPGPLLITLKQIQLVSSVLATALVGLSLVSYGTSVYVDRQLNQAAKRLSQLQRSEQQLTTANAILTSHMAQQAESSETGLQPPKPDSVIFLRPAPQRSTPQPESHPPSLRLPAINRPLGY